VTSVNLTPANKEEIAETLPPFIKAPQDIFDAEDLEGLLSSHPAGVDQHFEHDTGHTIALSVAREAAR
jgi:hypothetical protein